MSGSFYAIFAALLFGLSAPFAKTLLGETGPWLLAGLLYFGAGLGMFVVLLIRNLNSKGKSQQKISRSDLTWLAGVTLFGGVLGLSF